jgi:hypothetical protein
VLTVVWAYRRTGKFAFHVLTGALETDPRTAGVPVVFGNGVDAVVAAVREALARDGGRVLVGWSFYSPDAAQMFDELRAVKAQVSDLRALHVCGGVHASAEPEATLRAGFDLVAVGEGERLVRDLVDCLQRGGEPRDLPGIASLRDGALTASRSTTSRRSDRPMAVTARSRSRAAASTPAASARRRTSPAPTSATAASTTCGSGRAGSSAAAFATSAS